MNPDLKYAGVKGPGFLSQVPTLDPYRFMLLGPELWVHVREHRGDPPSETLIRSEHDGP